MVVASVAVVVAPVVLTLQLRAADVICMTRAIGAMAFGPGLEIAPLTRRAGTIFCDVQTQGSPADFPSVQLLDRLLGMVLGGESHECEASGATRFAVFRNVNVHDFPNLSKQRAKLVVRRCEVEVSYEYLA